VTRGAIRVEEVRSLARNAKSSPARAFRLVELVATPAGPTQPDAPLVGRAQELQGLRAAFDTAVAEQTCRLVTVLGEPGIGKSRLGRELQVSLGANATVLVGRCLAYGDGVTYWPVRDVVEQAAGGRDLNELVRDLDDGPVVASAVAAALGLKEGAAGEETFWAFRRLFTSIARRRPLVLILEDLHWAEPALLDLVDHLAESIRNAPVLILCLARPELLDTRPALAGGKGSTASLVLTPLSTHQSRELLALRAGTELAAEELDRMAATAGGNPLFLEQLLAHITERGAGDLSTPPAMQALLAARLDLAGAEERSLLECGAVEGEIFHVGSACALNPELSLADAERMLQGLVRRDLLSPTRPVLADQDAYRFRHALIRDAAYEQLSKATRSELHERHADWLEGLGEAVPEPDARIGFHLERAFRLAAEIGLLDDRARGLSVRAGHRLADAALNTFRRGDIAGQIGFLERAIDLLGREQPAAVELLPRLAYAMYEGGLYDRAAEVAERGVALSDRLDLGLVRLQSEVERSRLQLYLRPEAVDVDASIGVAERALRAFREVGDDMGLARVSYLLSELTWMTGRSEQSREHAGHVVEAARRAGSGFEVVAGLQYIAWPLVAGGTRVPEAIEKCLSLEREFAPQRVVELAGFHAVLEAMSGEFDRAREQMALARSHLAELGLRTAAMWMELFAAQAEMLADAPEAAERAVRDAERMAVEIGDRWFLAIAIADLAHVVIARGRLDEAAAIVRRIDTVPAPSDMEWLIKRHAARGKLAARQGHAEDGLADARRAVEVADTTDMLVFRADAYRDLAEVLLAVGGPGEAESAAATALELHEAKANIASARSVREFLRSLR
jgi:tetratricopeptide (TPR) repeat protein